MKNTNTCPKCRGRNILVVPGNVGAGTDCGSNSIMTGLFKAVLVDRYVCADCGFTEEWINKEDMPRLKKFVDNLENDFLYKRFSRKNKQSE